MRELVLGGEGLIGTELVATLKAKGHSVVSLDLKNGCDLRYVDDQPFEQCDRVWFLAWDTGGAKYIEASDRQHEMYKHNCELTARVLNAIARTRRPFLFVTSQLSGQPNAYGQTKLLAERWSEYLGGTIARLWNTYGWEEPDIRSHVMTDLVLSGLREGRVKTLTDGREHRRFIYKSDCVDNLINLFDSGQKYADIAGENWFTIAKVAEEVASQLEVEVELGRATGSEVLIDPKIPVNGQKPQLSLTEGIAMVIAQAREFIGADLNRAEFDVART
jgi:nucleoside-diphosphate-sugar epimerase